MKYGVLYNPKKQQDRFKVSTKEMEKKGFPRDIQRKIAYEAEFQNLCTHLKANEIAPPLLFEMAETLGVTIDDRQASHPLLCQAVRRKLKELFEN